MDVHPTEVSKAEFARMLQVDRSRITQYEAEGKLTAAAFSGEGRKKRVIVARALDELKVTLDIDQRVLNGRADLNRDASPSFNLDASPVSPPASSAVPSPAQSPTASAAPSRLTAKESELSAERLREARLKNQEREEQARARAGLYVLAEDMGRLIGGAVVGMFQAMESDLEVCAENVTAALSEKGLRVDARDLEILLVREFRRMREATAKQQQDLAAALPRLQVDDEEGSGDGDHAAQRGAPDP